MATYQELAQALQNAHRAGDTAAAQKLAQALKGMQAQQQMQPQQPTQSAFGQSVDQLQKLGGRAIQTIGAATGLQGVEDYGAKVVTDQERQIAEGGYVSPVGDMTFMESFNQGKMGDWFAARIPENAATIAATPVTAIGAGIATIMGAPVTATVLGGASLLTGVGLGIGGTADLGAEKGIDITDPNVARSNVAIGSVVGLLDRIGAGSIVGSVVPKEKLATMSTAEIAQIIAKKDKSKALQFLKNIFRGAAGEAATEGAQGATQIAGVAAQGGEFTSDEVLNQIVDEMAIGGSIGGGLTATADVGKGVASTVSRQPKLPEDAEASASFAQDIDENATTNNLKLNDLDKTSTKGARQVIDNLHQRYDEEMKMNRDILKTQLKIADNDPLLVRLDKTLAKLAYREARNKTKSIVNKDELEAVDRLVGSTKEGRELINLMRKMNELTRLHNNGYQGGLSKLTDQFAPFGSNIGYDRTAVNTEKLLRPVGSGLAALQTGGLSIVGQLGAQGLGRAVDAVRGGRSTVGSYVADNQNRQGLTGIDQPSVLEDSIAAQERAELEKQLQSESDALEQQLTQQEALSRRRSAYMNQDLPAAGSPEATMVIATEGVDQKTLEQLVEYIGQARPELKDSADAYLAAIRGETLSDVPGLTELIRAVKTFVDNTPQFADKKNPQLAARISENFTTPVAAAGGVPGYMNTPNYQRGIADNQAAADSLTEAVNNDANISNTDKAKLLDGLAQLRSNLGVNPAEKAVDIYNSTRDKLTDKALADAYMLPYVERVAGQQPNQAEGGIAQSMAAPNIGEGLSIFPKTQKLYKMIDGLEVDQGNYVNTADGSDVTGKSYDGARIYIKPDGKPAMEVDQNEVSTPTKDFGLRWYSNAVRPDRYKFVDNPTNHQGSIVTVEGRTSTSSDNKQKHYFALQYASDVPVELHRRKGGEPTLRPQGFGIIKPGNKIGTISMSGREHPLYDEIRIEPVNPQTSIQKIDAPLSYEMDPFGIGNDALMTSVDIMPTDEEIAQMKAGTYKPVKKQSKEAAYGNYHQDKWVPVAGQEEMLEYTPENVDRLAKMIATEALPAIRRDDSAIGWYDAKLKAAKAVMRIVEPRIDENEAPFDYVLALTSNGTAVTDNFQYALEAFRYYLDNGEMPTKWDKGGERASAIRAGFDFFNAYQKNVTDLPLAEFLDKDFRRSDLSQWAEDFNKRFGTELSVGVQENADAMVKGSYVLGAKIGQGFYQNIRGNYEPLTMDIWWMRMWNRMVGRPFEPPKTEADMQKNRNKIKRGMIDNKDKDMRKVINQALKNAGETRQGLYGDKERFDKFITALHKEYQKYYKAYKKKNGVNHVKPQLFKTVGTHFLNMGDQLKATPAGGSERAYMRQVVERTRELLKQRNYDINTADFQALMWYPEKQLARKMGVAPGKGEDNDYLDAAIIAAKKEGVNDDQIKEALPDTERERLFGGADSQGADGASNQGTSGAVQEIRGTAQSLENKGISFTGSTPEILKVGSRVVEPAQIRDQLTPAQELFAEDKPLPIGMPGTPFENGIQDVRVAGLIANALGYAFEIFKNPNRMKNDFKDRFNETVNSMGIIYSAVNPREGVLDEVEGKLVRGKIGVMGVYTSPKGNKDQTLPFSIFAALHELAHGIERLPMGEDTSSMMDIMRSPSGNLIVNEENIRKNTFRGYLARIIDAFDGNANVSNEADRGDFPLNRTEQELGVIVEEMIQLQMTGLLNVPGAGSTAMRPDYEVGARLYQQAQANNDVYAAGQVRRQVEEVERKYLQTPPELAADMIGAYLIDPATFKRQAPNSAQFVRDLLNTANAESSKFVKFYSAPMAMVIATIMAQLLLGEQEEEEKRGALSLGQAALTA